MRIIITSILLSFHTCSLYTQILDKIKQIANLTTTSDVLQFTKDNFVEYLKKSHDEYDASDFNYAVSFSDNSALYETEEKFGRTQKVLLYALNPDSYENRTDKEKADDYNDAGEMFYASGRYKNAENCFNNALQLYQKETSNESKQTALVISNLGLLYHTTGRYALADSFTKKSMYLRAKLIDDKKGLGASLNNLAVLYRDMGLYNESEEYITQAAEIIKKANGENSPPYAIALNNQGILYQTMGKYKESEQLLLKAINIAAKDLGKKSPNFIRMKVNLALLYQSENRYNEAEKIYLDAIEIKKRRLGTNHPDYALLLRNLAALYELKEQFDKVESYLNQAIGIYKNKLGTEHPSYANAIYDLGRYYQYQGKTDKAYPLLNEALKVQKNVLGEHHPSYVSTLEALAILYWQRSNYPMAAETYKKVMNEYLYQIKTYFPPMSEYDKTSFWENIYPKFIRFNSFVIDAEATMPSLLGEMYNYHIATKALLLNSTNKVKENILHSTDTGLIHKYNQWLTEKAYISKLYSFSKKELTDNRINLDSLENDANLKEKNLSKSSELFLQGYDNQTIVYSNIVSGLNKNEAAVEIIRFKHYNNIRSDTAVYYAALILTMDSKIPKLVLFKNGKELETDAARSYKKAMQNAREDPKFYDIYWNKLDDATANSQTLYMSLDGIYNQINLNTLQQQSGKYIIDYKNIILLSNTKNLVKSRSASSTISKSSSLKTAVLFGDPNYSKGLDVEKAKTMTLPELPGTRIEVTKISEILKKGSWKTTLNLGNDATEENVKSVRSPKVLHIATHGFFKADIDENKKDKVFGIEPVRAAENPLLRSGLMFTGADNTIQQIEQKESKSKDDGILNAYEAMMLNLDKTELVVLSACETGLGEIINGEGVYGLQRAFEVAGAKNVIISLWQVSDDVTQELMTSFYKNWLLTGNKQSAFIKAQLDIKKAYQLPYYWGAFVMVGD